MDANTRRMNAPDPPIGIQRMMAAVRRRDLEWFAAHPNWKVFVRPMVPGEWWPMRPGDRVVVGDEHYILDPGTNFTAVTLHDEEYCSRAPLTLTASDGGPPDCSLDVQYTYKNTEGQFIRMHTIMMNYGTDDVGDERREWLAARNGTGTDEVGRPLDDVGGISAD